MLIDIVFVILMLFAILKGLRKGFIIAIFSVIGFIIGLAAALKLSAVVAGYLSNGVNVSSKWLPVISFAIVFILVVLLVRWGASLIEKSVDILMLGWLNKITGVLLYAALYTIILSIFLFYAESIRLIDVSVIRSSATYTYIKPWGPKVIDGFGKLIPLFKDTFTDLENFFGSLPDKLQH